MFGFFSLLSTGVSTIYPIFATYKSFERYQKTASIASYGNVNIAGIQVPIVSLLKRATGSSELNEDASFRQEELLQSHSLATQKWLVYWIIYASYTVIESVLLLKYAVPFYSLWKTILFAWMISPIFMSRNSEEINQAALTKDWVQFSENGCGLCYYYYLKPWLDGEVDFLSKWDYSKLANDSLGSFGLGSVKPYVTYYLGKIQSNGPQKSATGSATAAAADATAASAANISSLASKLMDHGSYIFINHFFQQEQQAATSSGATSKEAADAKSATEKATVDTNSKISPPDDLDDDFDFVDVPKQEKVTNRKSQVKGSEEKKGWIW